MEYLDSWLIDHLFFDGDDTNRLLAELETYDQALAYIEATADTEDDFIITLAQVKAKEDDVAARLTPKALEIIARERNSDILSAESRSDLNRPNYMTVQHAYSLLGIDNPDAVDDDTVNTSHTVKLSDAPGRATELNEALSVIAEHRKSEALRFQVSSLTGNAIYVGPSSGGATTWQRLPITEPRGLNNIGNTCYLNSLLQYLFTVKPLREMISDFEKYKQVLPEEYQNFEKKVADMKVDREGVLRTQACERLSSVHCLA